MNNDDFEFELNEDQLKGVTAGYDSRLREIEKELQDRRVNGTLTPDVEERLMNEWNKIQGIEPSTGRRL